MSQHFHFCPACRVAWGHDNRSYVGKCGLAKQAVCDDCHAEVELDELQAEYEDMYDDREESYYCQEH